MTIVLTGSIAYDYLMTFPGHFKDHILPDKLDTISLSFLVDSMVRQRGGISPNIAYTLSLLGDRPVLMGTVGMDFEDYRAWLESHHIDTSMVRVIDGVFTASFFVNTDLNNNQIASFYTGAMGFAAVQSLKEMTRPANMVMISANDPKGMDKFVHECIEMGIPYIYDPSQQVVRSDPAELRAGTEGAASVFVNQYEYELLRKHTGLTHEDILKTVSFLVVTRGEDGASIYAGGQEYRVPIVPPVQILDPTGVGDAFRGGFLRGYELGLDWTTCGQMGAMAATYCLEQSGTQNHCYTIEEFIARFRKHFDDQGVLDVLLQTSQ